LIASVQGDVFIKASLSALLIRFIRASLFIALLLFEVFSRYTIFIGL
jgi:hypothetical protein